MSHIQHGEYAEQLKDIAEKTEKLCDVFIEGRSIKVRQSANKKASTLEVNLVMKAFNASISQHEGTIRSKFDSNSATYIMFFPSGMKGYHHANKNRKDLLMELFLSVSQIYFTPVQKSGGVQRYFKVINLDPSAITGKF